MRTQVSHQRLGLWLALAGTALIWVVLLAPLVGPLWVLIQRAYFALGLVGAGLLFAASLLRRRYRALAAAGLAIAVVAVLLQQALMNELDWIVSLGSALTTLVMAVYVIHVLSQVVLGVCGVLIVRLPITPVASEG